MRCAGSDVILGIENLHSQYFLGQEIRHLFCLVLKKYQDLKKKKEFQVALARGCSKILLALHKSSCACLMIQLADNLPDLLPIGQVRMKKYLPRRQIYLS